MKRALTFALGALADARFGDPPTRWHPVGLVGRGARVLHAAAPEDETARARYGFAVALGFPLAGALAAKLLSRVARAQVAGGGLVVDAALLDATSALHTLCLRATEVEHALRAGDLAHARALCGEHLVSRDTAQLSASEVAGATIESLAENLSDGVIAPWCWFVWGGVAGAVAYRVANTMDALWGYHSPEFESLGRGAARVDDMLNLVPARITALALLMSAASKRYGEGCSVRDALATWRADAGNTASPNAGQPMAMMAGALGVTLRKRDAYVLGAGLRAPAAPDIARAVRLVRGAALSAGSALCGASLLVGGLR